MSSTASLQFAPEWLKPRKTARQPSISGITANPTILGAVVASSESVTEDDNARRDLPSHPQHTPTTYSSLLTGRASPNGASGDASSRPDDEAHPFRYSKEQMLQVWKDGGGRGALNLEVERWPGVVREAGDEPISLKEWTGEEKKFFSQPLNSSHVSTYNPNHGQSGRRHPQAHGPTPISTSGGGGRSAFGGGLASPRDGRLGHNGSGVLGSPVSGGNVASSLGRRRKDDNGDPPVALYRPRQLSISTTSGVVSHGNPSQPSPRTRPGFEGVLGDSWIKKKVSDKPSALTEALEDADTGVSGSNEEGSGGRDLTVEHVTDASSKNPDEQHLQESPHSFQTHEIDALGPYPEESQVGTNLGPRLSVPSSEPEPAPRQSADIGLPPGVPIFRNEDVLWRYKDPSGQIQGPFPAATMQTWFGLNYFAPDLLIQRYRPLWDQMNPDAFETLTDYRKKLPPSFEHQIFSRGMELAPPVPPNLPIPMPSSVVDNMRESSLLPPNSTSKDHSLHGTNSSQQVHVTTSSRGGPDRHTSIDSRSNGTPHSGTISSAHVSPAFSNSLAQSYGNGLSQGSLANASPVPVNPAAGGPAISEERQRQEREEFFKLLRERELAISTATGSGPLRSGSVGGGLSVNTGLLYGNGPSGHPQQPVPRSPLYSTASPSISNQQTSYSPQQPSYLQSLNAAPSNVGPRLAQGQYQQHQQNPSNLPTSPFQPQPPNAWQQASSGQLARQTPHQAAFPEERDIPPGDSASWNDLRARDSFSRQHHVNAWQLQQQNQQQQDQDSQGQYPARRTSPYLFLNERYATAAAMQQVQSQSAGNFGLPKGFVDPRSDIPVQDTPEDKPLTSSSPIVNLPLPSAPQPSNDLPARPIAPPAEVNATRSTMDQVVEKEQVPVPSSLPPKPAPAATTKPTRAQKTSIPATSSIPSKVEPSISVTQNVPPDAPEPVAPPKPAWSAVSPIATNAGPSAGASLREIQEAEAKRSEARKAAEREREKALKAANPVPTPAEDLPKSTSWGLPQVGQRAAAASPTTSAAPIPAWSSASNTKPPSAKRTMKEIQEEEEKRKKALAAREAANGLSESAFVAAAGRKAFVETAKTVEAAKASGPWTTVGSSGKPIASSVTTPAPAVAQTRPPAVAARSSATVAAGTPVSKAAAASVLAKKVDDKVPPSPEFVKWVKEALRGLNGVNVDEFITMLFDFPIDPDASTIEIISEFVYANSSTLDGRRFATEFVVKRKADAASRVGKMPVGKPISIADVVKTQPKPAQPEWAYKVVKKKGKRT